MLHKKIKFIALGLMLSGSALSAEYLSDGSGQKVLTAGNDCWHVASGLSECHKAKAFTLSGAGLFDTAKATIRPSLAGQLNQIIAQAQGKKYQQIAIVGHTDNVGSDSYNQNLSHQRAISVGNYLASRGLAPNKIRVAGRGESQPVASNDNDNGRQQNRRVVITFN